MPSIVALPRRLCRCHGRFDGAGNPLRQVVARRDVQVVPILTRQLDLGTRGDASDALRVHRARNDLHVCRMAQDPRDGDGLLETPFASASSAST